MDNLRDFFSFSQFLSLFPVSHSIPVIQFSLFSALRACSSCMLFAHIACTKNNQKNSYQNNLQPHLLNTNTHHSRSFSVCLSQFFSFSAFVAFSLSCNYFRSLLFELRQISNVKIQRMDFGIWAKLTWKSAIRFHFRDDGLFRYSCCPFSEARRMRTNWETTPKNHLYAFPSSFSRSISISCLFVAFQVNSPTNKLNDNVVEKFVVQLLYI